MKKYVAIFGLVLAAVPPILEACGVPEVAQAIRALVASSGLCPGGGQ